MEQKEYKLFVGGLAYAATEQDVRAAFEQAGLIEQVVSIDVIADRVTGRAKGYAFVKMQDEDSMNRAVELVNGKEILGRAVSLTPARPRTDRPSYAA